MSCRLPVLVVVLVWASVAHAKKPKQPDYETQPDIVQDCISITDIRSYHAGFLKSAPHLKATLRNGCDVALTFWLTVGYYDNAGNQVPNGRLSNGLENATVAPGGSFTVVHWVCGSALPGDCNATNYRLRPALLKWQLTK
jgi:hypothetical protein